MPSRVHYGAVRVKHYGAPLFGRADVPCRTVMFAELDNPVRTQQIVVSNLRALMAETKMSIEELARRSGVSERMIAYIMAHERKPTLDTAESLAKAFGLAGWQLLVPDLPVHLAKTGKLEQLLRNYSRASEKGREYIDHVAEHEARYRDERK